MVFVVCYRHPNIFCRENSQFLLSPVHTLNSFWARRYVWLKFPKIQTKNHRNSVSTFGRISEILKWNLIQPPYQLQNARSPSSEGVERAVFFKILEIFEIFKILRGFLKIWCGFSILVLFSILTWNPSFSELRWSWVHRFCQFFYWIQKSDVEFSKSDVDLSILVYFRHQTSNWSFSELRKNWAYRFYHCSGYFWYPENLMWTSQNLKWIFYFGLFKVHVPIHGKWEEI